MQAKQNINLYNAPIQTLLMHITVCPLASRSLHHGNLSQVVLDSGVRQLDSRQMPWLNTNNQMK